jgi:hypothetical protein
MMMRTTNQCGFGRAQEPAQNTGFGSGINWEAPNCAKLSKHNILAKTLWNIFPVRGFLTKVLIEMQFSGTLKLLSEVAFTTVFGFY